MLQTREGRSDTNHQKAKDLLESLLQADIVKFVHFLLDVINVLSILSHVNQNRNSSIADIFATLESTLEMLRIYQTRWGVRDDLRVYPTRQMDLGNHFLGVFARNCPLGGFFFPPQTRAKRTPGRFSHTLSGNCLLGGKRNISDVRNLVLTHLIKRLRGCFRDVNQDVVKAATTGSFKLWPAKINQGNVWTRALNLLFFDCLYTCL